MSKGKLTEKEIEILRENPNVRSVSENRIIYKDEFKTHFMEEYLLGKKPTRIFLEAGFDKEILGPKRIERASARWRKKYEDGEI